jgi:hypothetical protein
MNSPVAAATFDNGMFKNANAFSMIIYKRKNKNGSL